MLHYHSQNLNERGGQVVGSMFWAGRAWLRKRGDYRGPEAHWEWYFGRKATDAALWVEFGTGDCDDGVLFHICIPWLISFFVGVERLFPRVKKPVKSGVGIHSCAIWFYPLSFVMESSRKDPWYRRDHYWSFPWEWNWYSTEILDARHDRIPVPRCGNQCPVVWSEIGKHAKDWNKRFAEEESVSFEAPYTYMLRNQEVQHRIAKVHVTRMTWRRKWWWLLRRKKVSTYIDVKFDGEVGEGTGSWKGGCTGCSYELLPWETATMCLRRMERERKFDR